MSFPELEVLNSHVSRVFRVEDVTAGDSRQWILRYRGQFLSDDTVAAYDQLADAIAPANNSALSRENGAPPSTLQRARRRLSLPRLL
jgi:hypothetical protein